MPKIYTKENYIIVENPTSQTYTRSELKYEENTTNFILKTFDKSIYNVLISIPKADISTWTDEDSVAYTETTLRSFLQEYTSSATIDTNPSNFDDDVALGRRDGVSNVSKFGFNTDIDTGTEELISSFGGAFDPTTDVMTTAQTFSIAFGASDGSGTTGATSLLITYIDENFEEQNGVHVLTASSPDTTSFTGLGINRAVVLSSGSAGYNNGDITITASSDATTQAQIPAQASVTEQLIYHTPISRSLMLKFFSFTSTRTSGSGAKIDINLYSWSRVTSTRYFIRKYYLDTSANGSINDPLPIPFPVGGREVIYATATTTVNNTQLSGRFSGNLYDVS